MSDLGQTKLDVERLRSWIGREDIASDNISADLVRKFTAALDLPDPSDAGSDVAPLLISYCLAQPAAPTRMLGEDGHPQKGGFLPPVPLPRRMWAGSQLRFHGDLRIGETVKRVSRIADVEVKKGRSGVLCFVTVEHRIEVEGVVRIEETQNIVYREADSAQDAGKRIAGEPAQAGRYRKAVTVSAPLLFRYSALTFNSHRIHYDRPYAVEVEHYPGLVVHGPLQATLLLNFAAELKGKPPSAFTFRGLSPLFDYDKVSLQASDEGGRMKLWTARESGPVALSAEAIW